MPHPYVITKNVVGYSEISVCKARGYYSKHTSSKTLM